MGDSEFVSLIRDLPDHPIPGVTFRDITPLLADAEAFAAATRRLGDPHRGRVDLVAGIEARGFMFGAPVAQQLGVGFVPIRKPGKLPGATTSVTYDLEYGSDSLEMHVDAVASGQRILLVDDVLATGGTAAAAVSLIEQAGAQVVAAGFLIELTALGGRVKLAGTEVHSLVTY